MLLRLGRAGKAGWRWPPERKVRGRTEVREGATMKPDSSRPAIETLAAVIAHSQIMVAQPHSPIPSLPSGMTWILRYLIGLPPRADISAAVFCGCRLGG